MSARGFLGAGDLYIARYNPDTGQFDAYKGPYEASKFEIKPKVDLKELTSKSRDGYGQVIESVGLAQPAEFTVELTEVNKESLAIALLGDSTAINQGSGTVVDEAISAALDGWVPLANRNVATAGLTVKNSAGTVTYVKDTDYSVNYRLGWIKAISGGAITDAEALKVSYTHNAVSGTQIDGITNAQIRAKFKLDGQNFADNSPCIVEVYEGVIAANSAFDFLASDFNKVSLPGRMKTPAGYTAPFKVELLDA
jgi:hypothetical protein